MTTQLKNVGSHRPEGMIVEIEDNLVEDALKSGEFVRVGEEVKKIEKIKVVEKEKFIKTVKKLRF